MQPKEFKYKYSAPSQEEWREIERIRNQYTIETNTESKVEKLRRLDSKVKNTANGWAISVGTLGILLFGAGLACVLELGQTLLGVALAAVGVVPVLLAYPLYTRVLAIMKKKYGAEILQLSEELLQEP